MNPIRPNLTPNLAPQTQGQGLDVNKLAAQKAFFAAAMGQAQTPPAASAAQAPPAPGPTAIHRIPDPGAEPPSRVLRPGSLLDIRI